MKRIFILILIFTFVSFPSFAHDSEGHDDMDHAEEHYETSGKKSIKEKISDWFDSARDKTTKKKAKKSRFKKPSGLMIQGWDELDERVQSELIRMYRAIERKKEKRVDKAKRLEEIEIDKARTRAEKRIERAQELAEREMEDIVVEVEKQQLSLKEKLTLDDL